MEESRQESEQLKEEYDRIAENIAALDQTITEKQALGNEARMNARNLEGRISVLNEQIRAEEMNAEHIRSRIAAIESELQEKKKGTEAAIRKKSSSLRSRWRPWRSGSVREKTSWSRLLPVYPALKDPLRTEKRR